jgi:hypothetical protein
MHVGMRMSFVERENEKDSAGMEMSFVGRREFVFF